MNIRIVHEDDLKKTKAGKDDIIFVHGLKTSLQEYLDVSIVMNTFKEFK